MTDSIRPFVGEYDVRLLFPGKNRKIVATHGDMDVYGEVEPHVFFIESGFEYCIIGQAEYANQACLWIKVGRNFGSSRIEVPASGRFVYIRRTRA